VGISRSTHQYQKAPKDEDSLRLALIRLAKHFGRYGYRKITQLLKAEGWEIKQFEVTVSEARVSTEERVERIWREEGLQLLQRYKKRRRLYHKDSPVICLRPKYASHIWSVDFRQMAQAV